MVLEVVVLEVEENVLQIVLEKHVEMMDVEEVVGAVELDIIAQMEIAFLLL